MGLAHLRISKEASVAGAESARGKILGDEVREVMGGQVTQGLAGHSEDVGSDSVHWESQQVLSRETT